jgi:hypothetical protein
MQSNIPEDNPPHAGEHITINTLSVIFNSGLYCRRRRRGICAFEKALSLLITQCYLH